MREEIIFIVGALIGALVMILFGFVWPFQEGKKDSDQKWIKRLSDAGYEYRGTIVKKDSK